MEGDRFDTSVAAARVDLHPAGIKDWLDTAPLSQVLPRSDFAEALRYLRSVKVAQELARHGSPTLTIGRYSHVRLQDLRGALAAVPVVSVPALWRRLDVARP